MYARVIDRRSVTFADCLEQADVFMDGFRNDLLFKLVFPTKYIFSEDFTKFAPRERKLKQQAWDRLVWSSAMRTHLQVLGGASFLVLLYDDEAAPKAIGCAIWNLPRFSPTVVRLSFFEKIALRVRSLFYSAWETVVFWVNDGARSPLSNPEIGAIHAKGEEMCGGASNPKTVEKFAELTYDQLKKETYPTEFTYYLNILSVRMDHQRRGVGKKLVDVGVEFLPRVGPVFQTATHKAQGPPKLALTSSPLGQKFYTKEGFTLAGSYTETRADGEVLPHRYFQRLLE